MRLSIGASLNGSQATFTVWAPLSLKVVLELKRDNGRPAPEFIPMRQEERGYWRIAADNVRIGDRYGFCLDDSHAYPDPASRWQPDGVHGISAVADGQSYHWQDAGWRGIPLRDTVVYELHVGTFTPEGTFEAVIGKLDHLVDLGVNTLEIMPVAQFPGGRNWGYDGVYPFAVQDTYGGADGLKTLVDACHQRGVAVCLDVVYNHMGPEGCYLSVFGPYFAKKYDTLWGRPLNYDDAYSDEVRNYFIQNALMWLDEFHIDALRLDATDHILDISSKHFLTELGEEVRKLERKNGRPYVLVAERDLNDLAVLQPLDQNGHGFDGQWLDNFHHALHVAATGDQSHYYADYNGLEHLSKAMQRSYVYDGQYSPMRKRTHGVPVGDHGFDRFVAFAQNHDQVGNRLLSDRLSAMVSPPMLRVVAGTYLLSPHVPLLFMGEEYGETNPFHYFVSHTDHDLIQAVREGRRKEFEGFHQEGTAYKDPQSQETFEQSKLSWDLDAPGRRDLLNFYRRLIVLRKSESACRNFARDSVRSWTEHNVLLWTHAAASPSGQALLCVANFGQSQQPVTLPDGEWQPVLDSQSVDTESFTGQDCPACGSIEVIAEAFLVFRAAVAQ